MEGDLTIEAHEQHEGTNRQRLMRDRSMAADHLFLSAYCLLPTAYFLYSDRIQRHLDLFPFRSAERYAA